MENTIEKSEEIRTKYETVDGKQTVLLSVKATSPLIPLLTCIYTEFKKGVAITISYAGMWAGHQTNKAVMYAREKLCKEDGLDFNVQMFKHFTIGKKNGDQIEIFYCRLLPVDLSPAALKDFRDG